ncbi:MAG TPA: hypothetical protein PLA72_10760 [Smithellaceae bacterium]|nr:hypothetical protein [Smithellaceae bacterium]
MSFISKLFKRKIKPKFDLEKAVGEYLLKLPRCSRNVVIVSPKYGETHYACEIVVAAEDLVPWAEHHADAVWSSNQEEQAARKSLPIWLRGSKSEDNSASYVPHCMYKVLRPYVLNFVNEGTTNIYCPECQSFVADVKMEKLNEKTAGDWSWWTDVWTCSKEHQLYYEEHELHIHRRR